MTKITLQALVVAAAACLSLPSVAADNVTPSTPNLTKDQAHDLKTENKAEYKASKKLIDAQKDLDVADCKTSGLDSKNERDCKKEVKDTAKASKKEAKENYKEEKAEIKAHTK